MDNFTVSRRRFIGSAAAVAAIGSIAPRSTFAAEESVSSAKGALAKASGYYPFKIGSMTCSVISDGTLANTISSFGPVPDVNENQKIALLEQAFLRKDPVIGYENALYIESPTAKILIDTGSNGAFGPQTGKLAANLQAAGIDAKEIDVVLISHAHPDHINGLLNADGSLAFPKAEVFFSADEFAFWSSTSPNLSKTRIPAEWRPNLVATAQKVFAALGSKLKTFKNNESPVTGITARMAPGHTPGHCIFEIVSGGEQLFYTSDLCNHQILLLEKPEWSFAFDIDPVTAIKSKKKFFDQFSSDKSRLLAYHFPFPGLWHIAKNSSGYKWVPENWVWE